MFLFKEKQQQKHNSQLLIHVFADRTDPFSLTHSILFDVIYLNF